MRFNGLTRDLFGTRSNIQVMEAICRYGLHDATGREVARLAGVSAPAAIKALKKLEDYGVLDCEIGKRQTRWRTRPASYVMSEIIRPLISADKIALNRIKRAVLSAVKNDADAVYLFGSVARDEATHESDVDVCIVTARPAKVAHDINDVEWEIQKTMDMSLSPLILTPREFKSEAFRNTLAQKEAWYESHKHQNRRIQTI